MSLFTRDDAWHMPFIIAGVACIAGAVISTAIRPPKPKTAAVRAEA